MQIKIFKALSAKKLESDVNEFIKDKEIIDIKGSSCTAESWKGSETTIIVMYK